MCQLEKHNGHDTAPVNVVSQFQTVRRKLKKTKMILDSKVDDLKLSLNEMNKNKIEMEDKSYVMKKKIDNGKNFLDFLSTRLYRRSEAFAVYFVYFLYLYQYLYHIKVRRHRMN